MGGGGYGGVGRGRLYTYRYTVTTRMTCIKMGSDESHFNVSLIVRDKVTRLCPQTSTFEEKGGSMQCLYIAPSVTPSLPRVQELCESRGGRPGLPVLTSLTVSVDVKQH